MPNSVIPLRISGSNVVLTCFAHGVIDGSMKSKPDVVRIRRKCYLHLWSEEHEQLRKNAVSVYNATVSLVVVKVIGQDCQDGKLLLNPAFVT
jgi:hypothetical protein